jgi:hypothetical protein
MINANIPANRNGTNKVRIMNDFFLTRFRYSFFSMSSVLFMFKKVGRPKTEAGRYNPGLSLIYLQF